MFQSKTEGIFSTLRPEVWLSVGILFAVFVADKLLKRWKFNKNLPPGPMGLPVVGYLPLLTKSPHLKFIELTKKYGNVFSMYLGSQLTVVLNDTESIREAFAKQELLARPPNNPFTLFGIESPFFTSNFKMWKEQRRFIVQTMKDLGLGKSKIEGHIQDEIQYFLKVLEKFEGKPLDIYKPLTPSMSNNICALVFGERYDYDDSDRITLDKALEVVTKIVGQTSFHIFFPCIKNFSIILKLLNYDKAIEAFGNVYKLVEEKIRRHVDTLDSKNVRDYIDGYLLEMKNRQNDKETTLSAETLKGTIINLFGAGSETVRTTISWCLYTMAAYPAVQKKVQKEIDSVIGSNKLPQLPDQKDMLYTQAVIREMMRWKTVAPLGFMRYVLEDIEVSGYRIPKGAIVLPNLWAVHTSPKYWKEPESFRPERFLNEDGTLLKTNHFIPFSVGKRSCPGEAMAMMEVFLYFVSILQKFNVSFPEGFKPDFEAHLGVTYRLYPFEICFTPK